MVNKQRVRRIKNLIYAFMILVLFLPLIFMSVLSLRMIDRMKNMSEQLDDLRSTVSQIAPSSSFDDSGGYVIEPEDQNAAGDVLSSQGLEENNTAPEENQIPDYLGANQQPEDDGAPIDVTPSGSGGTFPDDELLSIGGNAGIGEAQSGGLNSQEGAAQSDGTSGAQSGFDGGNASGTQDMGMSGSPSNPNTGNGSSPDAQRPKYDPNGNPLTGR